MFQILETRACARKARYDNPSSSLEFCPGGSFLATHKSAEKRARQSVKRNTRNTAAVGAVRTLERKLRTALAGNDKKAATTLMNDYMSLMAKAGTKGVVHAKTASRKIGRLATRVSKLGTATK
jgi:small subunit ribosomal protein S20